MLNLVLEVVFWACLIIYLSARLTNKSFKQQY